jgi:hypothetical protein
MTPCSSLKVKRCFEGTYRFHIQGRIRRARCQRESCCASPAQSFSGPSTSGLITIFCCLRFETPLTWRARSPYLYPPGTGWPGYTPRHWVPFSSPPTTRRVSAGLECSLYSFGADPTENTYSTSPSAFFVGGCLAIARISFSCLSDVTKQRIFLHPIVAQQRYHMLHYAFFLYRDGLGSVSYSYSELTGNCNLVDSW